MYMYVYIYIYIYVCMYIYIYMYMYPFVGRKIAAPRVLRSHQKVNAAEYPRFLFVLLLSSLSSRDGRCRAFQAAANELGNESPGSVLFRSPQGLSSGKSGV